MDETPLKYNREKRAERPRREVSREPYAKDAPRAEIAVNVLPARRIIGDPRELRPRSPIKGATVGNRFTTRLYPARSFTRYIDRQFLGDSMTDDWTIDVHDDASGTSYTFCLRMAREDNYLNAIMRYEEFNHSLRKWEQENAQDIFRAIPTGYLGS